MCKSFAIKSGSKSIFLYQLTNNEGKMKSYDNDQFVEIKRLYVIDGKSALEISKIYQKKPTAQTILNWAKKFDWDTEKEKAIQDKFDAISPKNLASKILEQISAIVNKDGFTPKDADALAKLQSALQKVTDKNYQLPVMYQVLTDFLEFIRINYPLLLTDDLIKAVRDFKNEIKAKLEA